MKSFFNRRCPRRCRRRFLSSLIPATGTVVRANVSRPSTETLGREVSAAACVVHNLSLVWTRWRQGSHKCQRVAIDVVWIHRESSRLCLQQTCEIFLIR